ncbi:acyl-CoA oxidase [Basidiobolus meristosporus CBS 931.73]|uniref:Acyl-coenzyme A oxidase n=1 Tax=Basidiobolus meristosporus CBS 931.73 TaxID=1314790 RepID=A0A1Y1VXB2_9FUNG|nr:acyl-CoA oxidase [Basidiobolus meristosporus CBS 931.73]|eukprot:ORX65646.1 acyl-CoA oxidase [Basidiobolus meristosporus CBS 931.73]
MISNTDARLASIKAHIGPKKHTSNVNTQQPPRPTESIAAERANPSFPVRELTYYLDGGEEETKLMEKFMFQLERDPLWRMDGHYNLSLPEVRERTLLKLRNVLPYLANESMESFRKRFVLMGLVDPAFNTRLAVHISLFFSTIQGQATPAQYEYWFKRGALALNGVIGCFAMTELGHGSNVAGLETTATFDEATDEFIVHTPTVTATKWWIGGAAHTATHTTAFAQLIVKGKNYGVKPFVVPLRDPKTFNLLPGINIGDIGKKMGRDGIDNGWIQFTHVRIPRQNMLMKYAQVTRTGKVIQPPLAQLAYGALIGGRVSMVRDSANFAKKALTIALRYAAVRRQFSSNPKQPETKILDYVIHQNRLLPLLAEAVAVNFTSSEVQKLYNQLMDQLENARPGQDLSETIELLKETHATTAGLKAFCTWNCLSAIEQCRQACGGHGYSGYTGLASMYSDFAIQCTWEGDNTILTLQTGRSLITAYLDIKRGKNVSKGFSYLKNAGQLSALKCPGDDVASIANLDTISEAWSVVAANAVKISADIYEAAKAKGISKDAALESCAVERLHAARMHSYGYIFNRFADAVRQAPESIRTVLTNLCLLYGLHSIKQNAGEFLSCEYFTASQLSVIREQVNHLCSVIRKDAIPLVDSFNYTDYIINSPLGRYDGNIYEAYFNLVKANNPQQPVPYFESVIRPILSANYKQTEIPDLEIDQ